MFGRARVLMAMTMILWGAGMVNAADWNPLPDTGQVKCFSIEGPEIPCPAEGESLYGQDGNYAGPTPYYQANGDGTVTDMHTTLTWQQGYTNVSLLDWQSAVDYCANLELGNHNDWRLPERMELKSIVDYSLSGPACDPVHQCGNALYSFWTATEDAVNSAQAWTVQLLYGRDSYRPKSDAYYTAIKCVRGGL